MTKIKISELILLLFCIKLICKIKYDLNKIAVIPHLLKGSSFICLLVGLQLMPSDIPV